VAQLEAGTMMDVEPGEDVKFTDPADVGGNYEAFERQTLLRIGAGLGLPYDMLTGDLSQTSYSSIRAGILAFPEALRADPVRRVHLPVLPSGVARVHRGGGARR
jgi:capsid protein